MVYTMLLLVLGSFDPAHQLPTYLPTTPDSGSPRISMIEKLARHLTTDDMHLSQRSTFSKSQKKRGMKEDEKEEGLWP